MVNEESAQEQAARVEKPMLGRRMLAPLGLAGVVLASQVLQAPPASAATVTTYAVKDIANLRTIPTGGLAANQGAYVEGYYAGDDEGGGWFYWDASSSAADNGGTVILPTGYAGTGRWKRVRTP